MNSRTEIVGFTIGNDMSSRDIEGENPLYLPQAKTYDQCCGIGPFITLTSAMPAPDAIGVSMRIFRGGSIVFQGETSTAQMAKNFEHLVGYLKRDNTFANGVLLLLKHFHHLLPRKGRAVFATLSARVGSISDNRLGGWYSYRASKAALNMMLKTAAIEISRKRPEALCLALHPGTVDTALSKPFAPRQDRFSPQESAGKLLEVIDQAEAGQSGRFLAYDGSEIAW